MIEFLINYEQKKQANMVKEVKVRKELTTKNVNSEKIALKTECKIKTFWNRKIVII